MVCTTFRTSPASLAKFQSFIDMAALAAGLGARSKAVYLYEVHAIPPAFIFKHGEEHTKGRIDNSLCQMMVALHTLHVQILHADCTHLAVVRKCMGYLVKVILAAVGYMLLQACNLYTCLVTVCRAFLFAAQALLKHGKPMKASLQVLRVLESSSVRTYRKRLDAQVYTYSCLFLWFGSLEFLDTCIHQYRCVIFAGRCHADGNGLYRSSELAVEYGRNILGFGYRNGSSFKIHTAMLRAKETLPALA